MPERIDWDRTTVLDTFNERGGGGWWEANMLSTPQESEYGWFEDAQAYHTTCVLGSWNALTRVKVSGPDAEQFLMSICVNTFKNYYVGRVKHALFCNEDGKIIINGLLIHESEDEYIFTSGPFALWIHYCALNAKAKGMDLDSELIDECSWAISGPTSVYAAEKACGESLRDIKFMHFRYVTVGGVRCRCIRQSMTAELGYEFQAPSEYSDQIQKALEEAGEEFGVVEYGGKGGLTQEAESGFLQVQGNIVPAVCSESAEDKAFRTFMEDYQPGFFHQVIKRSGSFEVTDMSQLYRSPIEIGEGSMVKFDHDFLGREALEAEAANPPRQCRNLIWNADDVIDIFASLFQHDRKPYQLIEIPHFKVGLVEADQVLDREGRLIGISNRKMYSGWYRCYFSNCWIDSKYADLGQELTVVYGDSGEEQKHVRCTVAPLRLKEDHRRDDVSALPSYL